MEKYGLIAYLISWVTLIAGIFTLFEKASDSLKEDSKAAVSKWLMNAGTQSSQLNWPTMFAVTFDSIFTKKHLSFICLRRSCVASIFGLSITSLVAYAINPSLFTLYIFDDGIPGGLLGLYVFGAILNFIPDYISLLETRLVIKWMSKKPTFLNIGLLLIFDIVATDIIFLLALTGLNLSVNGEFLNITPMGFIDGHTNLLSFNWPEERSSFLGLYLYTTFFTSIWVWLYACSGFFVGIIGKLKIVLGFLKDHLAIEDRPLRSLGLISVLITTIIYLVFGLFLLH